MDSVKWNCGVMNEPLPQTFGELTCPLIFSPSCSNSLSAVGIIIVVCWFILLLIRFDVSAAFHGVLFTLWRILLHHSPEQALWCLALQQAYRCLLSYVAFQNKVRIWLPLSSPPPSPSPIPQCSLEHLYPLYFFHTEQKLCWDSSPMQQYQKLYGVETFNYRIQCCYQVYY